MHVWYVCACLWVCTCVSVHVWIPFFEHPWCRVKRIRKNNIGRKLWRSSSSVHCIQIISPESVHQQAASAYCYTKWQHKGMDCYTVTTQGCGLLHSDNTMMWTVTQSDNTRVWTITQSDNTRVWTVTQSDNTRVWTVTQWQHKGVDCYTVTTQGHGLLHKVTTQGCGLLHSDNSRVWTVTQSDNTTTQGVDCYTKWQHKGVDCYTVTTQGCGLLHKVTTQQHKVWTLTQWRIWGTVHLPACSSYSKDD